MAATDVYVEIRRVPFGNAPPAEKVSFINIQATSSDFWLSGGYYGVDIDASTFGTVTLKKKPPTGSTYLTVGTSTTFSANGTVVVLLGPGHYQLALA